MRRTGIRWLCLLLALVATLAAACTGSAGPDASRTTTISGATVGPSGAPTPVKIAVFQDLSNEDPTQLVTPAYLGLQLSLTEGASSIPVAPQLEALDVQGDPARAISLAQQVASDPSYVAAVIAPFWAETRQVGDILNAANIPTLSLSALGPDIPSYGWTSWRRLVPTQPHQADSLAALVEASANSVTGVCIVRDDTAYSIALASLLKTRLGSLVAKMVSIQPPPATDAFGQAAADIATAKCRTVVWTGFAASGALLRTTLTSSGLPGVVMYGADAVKDEPFLTLTGSAGNGTVVTCPCVDLATSTDPVAQRFVHDYQSEFGASPGVYAAEGWDAGTMLLTTFRTGAATPTAVAAGLGKIRDVSGLAGAYGWSAGGELAPSVIQVHTYADRGQRWTPLAPATTGPADLPLPTQGLLTAAACRTGLPFNAEVKGRPAGFDVDLATALAKSLGVKLGWQSVPCDKAQAELARGTLDVLFTPREGLPQGTPSSRIALSIHTALVTRKSEASSLTLGSLGPGDRVGVVTGPVATPWIQQVFAGPGARIRKFDNPADAYDALVRGDVTAVADTEYGAWAGVERRSRLVVAQTFDAGAHDVLITSGSDTALLAAVDGSLGHLVATGRYALLWTRWFPGATLPPEVGH